MRIRPLRQMPAPADSVAQRADPHSSGKMEYRGQQADFPSLLWASLQAANPVAGEAAKDGAAGRCHEHRRKCPPCRRESFLSPRQAMDRFRRQRKAAKRSHQDRTLQPRLFRPDRPLRPRRGALHDVRRAGDRRDRGEGVCVLKTSTANGAIINWEPESATRRYTRPRRPCRQVRSHGIETKCRVYSGFEVQ